jgi:hypothetical protein
MHVKGLAARSSSLVLPAPETNRKAPRRTSRRRDYNGRYTSAVQPATWQEKMESLLAGLEQARHDTTDLRLIGCQRAIAQHRSLDPAAYDLEFALRPVKGGAK